MQYAPRSVATCRRSHSRTRGCTMASNFLRACGSANTRSRIARRASEPSASSTSGPNTNSISVSAGSPGSTTARAATSASYTFTPSVSNRRVTSLLPAATPPVSATMNREWPGTALPQPAEPQVGGKDAVAEHEPHPSRGGEEGAERNRRGAILSTYLQGDQADDRADEGRQQDRRQQRDRTQPCAQRAQQFE